MFSFFFFGNHEGMADYQYVVPVHADVAKRKKRSLSEPEETHLAKGGRIDVVDDDFMLIVPPIFAPKDMPENLVLTTPTVSSSKKKEEEIVQTHFELSKNRLSSTSPITKIL
jgi:general transcription factor 3C polypeptide 5 (transcription factor C subunit 1)